MQTETFLIFPNQLCEDYRVLRKFNKIYLIEEPIYFYDSIYKPFKPNKIKIAYMRACMKYYQHYLKKNKIPCEYIDYSQIDNYKFLDDNAKITCYDPTDHDLLKKLLDILDTINLIETPNFLHSINTLKPFFKLYVNPKHSTFYEFSKKKLNILHGIKNMDKDNRNPPPIKEPNVPRYKPSSKLLKYYNEAISYTNTHFSDHYGSAENVTYLPITSSDSYNAFKLFLKNGLKQYGKYQDSIMENDTFMYHSVISPMLNIGLLDPRKIIKMTLEYYEKNKSTIPLASVEGYIRQIAGWREYQRGLYMFKYNDIIKSNIPNNQRKFKDIKQWYKGETGIHPVDNEIKKALKYGYAHHIVRLMIFMNFFILLEIDPYEIYKWFMEVVSIDAYSWVMVSNIYTMGFFYNKAMSKPYISSSNYILKMSNYKKDGKWDTIWDSLYHDFVMNKPQAYTFFYKRTNKKNKEYDFKTGREFKNEFTI